MRWSALAALCLLSAFAETPRKSAFDKTTLEAYVRHLLAVVPEVEVKVDEPKPSPVAGMKEVEVHFTYRGRSQDETFYVSNDGKHIVRGGIFDVNENPFKADLDKLHTDLSPSYGTPGAPVVVVAFGDFECPNCKDEALAMRQNLEKTFPGQVRFYYKDFPLEQIHPWAKPAALAGRCIFRQNPAAFWQYHDWIYEHQADVTAENFKTKLQDFSKIAKDLDSVQLGRCIDAKSAEADVDKEIAEARALHIDATPTVFVNGRRLVGNYPWQNLEQVIAGELKYQKTANNAGEKCCEVKIPSPLNK